jgi:N-acetylglutamate synthase/N-acetylornithine aminotransferase
MPGRRAGHFRINRFCHVSRRLAARPETRSRHAGDFRHAPRHGAAGIKYKGRTDVLLALFDKGTTVAGVLTRSKCPSAPVEWCRAKLKSGKARALVVNSGNANAFTGKTGRAAAAFTAKLAAQASGCKPRRCFSPRPA